MKINPGNPVHDNYDCRNIPEYANSEVRDIVYIWKCNGDDGCLYSWSHRRKFLKTFIWISNTAVNSASVTENRGSEREGRQNHLEKKENNGKSPSRIDMKKKTTRQRYNVRKSSDEMPKKRSDRLDACESGKINTPRPGGQRWMIMHAWDELRRVNCQLGGFSPNLWERTEASCGRVRFDAI